MPPSSPTTRRERDRADRHTRIVTRARELAEAEGWDHVTTRRLAEAIEYTQPVLYSHFAGGKDEIMTAVAHQGFGELAAALSSAAGRRPGRARIMRVLSAYLDYAAGHPATYDAMSAQPIRADFGGPTATSQMRAAFAAIEAVLPNGDRRDSETAAELLWAAMHGLASLDAGGRLRPAARRARLDLLADVVSSA